MKYLVACLLALVTVVEVHAQSANFTVSPFPASYCAPVQINLTALDGTVSSWDWTITGPQGFTSNDQFPAFTLLVPGTYNIELSVNGGADVQVQTVTAFAPPVADFEADVTTGCAPLAVQFTDLTVPGDGTLIDWTWDLGEGGIINGVQNPFVIYQEKNIHDVEMVVTDDNGCFATVQIEDYIVINKAPEPDFEVNPPGGCEVPTTVTIVNNSLSQVGATYEWSFPGGDPASASGYNPGTVTYNIEDSYDITLQTTDGVCTDDTTIVDAVVIDLLVPNFTISNANPCEGEQVTFTDNSSILGFDLQWSVNGNPIAGATNPVFNYVFTTTGTIPVTLDVSAPDGSCQETITRNVIVEEGPNITFTSNQTRSCSAPFTVDFSSNVAGAVDYQWTFNPPFTTPITATGSNPSVTFNSPGNYDVTLEVTLASGCTGTFTINDYIQINEDILVAAVTNLDRNEGCAPLDVELNVQTQLPDGVSVASVSWDTPGGIPASGMGTPIRFDVNYPIPGVYTATATLNFTGGCGSVTTSVNIFAGEKPNLTASITPDNICLNEEVFGTATSDLPNTQFDWYFEPPGGYVDGGIGTTSDAPYLYEDEWQQPWEVLMVGDNGGCKDTVMVDVNVAAPAAQFDFLIDCENETQVNFTFNSQLALFAENVFFYVDGQVNQPIYQTNNVGQNTFSYDFGTLDEYEITMIAESPNITGCTDSSKQVIDLVNNIPNVQILPDSICPGESVIFFEQTPGIVTRQWAFGDGDTSVIQPQGSFLHVYEETGIYEAYLFTVNEEGCEDTLGPARVYVGGGNAIIDGVLGQCTPTLVTNFSASDDEFIFGVESANWNIGLPPPQPQPEIVNGPISVGPYTYDQFGQFLVTMTSIDPIGCEDDTFAIVNIGDVIPNFTSDVQDICPGDPVTFNNNTLGGNLAYLWDFGDGNTSTEQDPVHTYGLSGQYTVTLSAIDTMGGCGDTIVKPLYINAVGLGYDFIGGPDLTANCPPLVVNFQLVPGGATLDDFDYINWYFEESNELGTSGDVLSQSVTGQNIYVEGGPDGEGFYDVAVAISAGGCRDTIYKNDYVFVGGQRGRFTFDPDTICIPESVNFRTVNVARTDSIFWDFGGGAFLNVPVGPPFENFDITYTDPGIYRPVILLKNSECPPVAYDPNRAIYASEVIANAWVPEDFLCDGGDLSFIDSTIVSLADSTGDFIADLLWDFGDGGSSPISNPTHNYVPQTASYDVSLSVETEFGCTDTFNFEIEIVETPDGQIGPGGLVCPNQPIQLTASGASDYQWSPVSLVNDATSPTPVAFPADTTDFQVLIYNDIRCPDTQSVRVGVVDRIDAVGGPDAQLCTGEAVQLEVYPLLDSNFVGDIVYQWAPPSGLSSTTISNPIAAPTQDIIYQVTVTSPGCQPADIIPIQVEVGGVPFVDAGDDQVISQGESAQLFAFSPNLVTYTWFDINGNFIANEQQIVVAPDRTSSYIVEVGNAACRDIDTVDILILEECDQGRVEVPNVFTPNGDGVNDRLNVAPGLGVAEIGTFRIFNRWGELVFEATSETVIWDGTQGGQPLDPGVYVYYIELICTNDDRSIRKGNITLLK